MTYGEAFVGVRHQDIRLNDVNSKTLEYNDGIVGRGNFYRKSSGFGRDKDWRGAMELKHVKERLFSRGKNGQPAGSCLELISLEWNRRRNNFATIALLLTLHQPPLIPGPLHRRPLTFGLGPIFYSISWNRYCSVNLQKFSSSVAHHYLYGDLTLTSSRLFFYSVAKLSTTGLGMNADCTQQHRNYVALTRANSRRRIALEQYVDVVWSQPALVPSNSPNQMPFNRARFLCIFCSSSIPWWLSTAAGKEKHCCSWGVPLSTRFSSPRAIRSTNLSPEL